MKKHKKLLKKKREAKQAKIKIQEYFRLASRVFPNKKLSNDYIRKARNLAMKYKIRLPRTLKRRFCKHCYSYLVPGKNLRVRLQGRKIIYYCLECKKFMRFPYYKRK